MNQPLNAEEARAAKPASSTAFARLLKFLHKHISINEPLAEMAGRERNIVATPKWQKELRKLVSEASQEAANVPQNTPQQGTAVVISVPDVGFPANLGVFVARRDAELRTEITNTRENLTLAETLAIGLADKIAQFKTQYEWVTELAGGQEMLDNGRRLRTETPTMINALMKLAGELLGGMSKVTNDEQLEVWAVSARGLLRAKYDAYNKILNEVIRHVQQIIDSEAWKTVAQKYPQYVKTEAAVEVIASILSGIVTAAETAAIVAAPATFGLSVVVNMAGGAARLSVNEIKLRILKRLRDMDIAELKRTRGAHAQRFAYEHLNRDITMMAERVLRIQTENTERIVKVVGVGLEALPGWSLISTAVIAGVNAYYQARVEALKAFLESQGARVQEKGGLKAALKEWFAGDAAKWIAPESAADFIGKIGSDRDVFRAMADNLGAKEWGKALGVAVPAEIAKAAPNVLATLAITLAGKLLAMVIAKMPIEMAQPIDGNDLLEMKELLNQDKDGFSGPNRY